jgi:hypothetical protein
MAANQRILPCLVSHSSSFRHRLTLFSRFSLVPAEGNRAPEETGAPSNAVPGQPGNNSVITGVLQRLFGQSGTTSTPTSPTRELASPGLTAIADPMNRQAETSTTANPHPVIPPLPSTQSSGQTTQMEPRIPNSIPDDYRERHRRREREQQGYPE